MLYGRETETARVDRLVRTARRGGSASLLLTGEPGSGKSALLDHAATLADDMTVLRATAVPAETGLPYAALHMLLRPLLHRLPELPAPQAAAIATAFGMRDGGEVNRFAIGLATLHLLAAAGADRPVLCLLDDTQWMDEPSSEAVGFAVRRLDADRVAVLMARRASAETTAPGGISVMHVPGLHRAAAERLLDACGVAPGLWPAMIGATGGNPLALRELARTGTAADFTDPGGPALPRRAQDLYAAELAVLDEVSRTVLVVAATQGGGDLDAVLRATERLGSPAAALDAAVAAGLVEVTGGEIRFRHPLLRSTVYQTAPATVRRDAHRALAEAYRAGGDADRAAWHAAASVTGTDDRIADELAHAADRARERGGHSTAVSLYARSAELSTGDAIRAARLIQAAESAGDTGMEAAARDLASRAATLTGDPHAMARIAELRAEAELLSGRPASVPDLLCAAAEAVADTDPGRAVILYTHLLNTAIQWGRPEWCGRARDGLVRFEAVGGHFDRAVAAGRGAVQVLTGDAATGTAAVRGLLEALRPIRSGLVGARHFAAELATLTDDLESAVPVSEALLDECRDGNLLGWLPTLHTTLGWQLTRSGRLREARIVTAEGLRLATDLGQHRPAARLEAVLRLLNAHTGTPDTAPAPDDTPGDAQPWVVAVRGWAAAVTDLAAGRGDEAAGRWDAVMTGPAGHTPVFHGWAPDHVEAATRSGRADTVRETADRFIRWARGTGRPPALALAARCEALLAGDERAEASFQDALRHHETHTREFDQARTRLVYGERLRRDRRRSDARRPLRAALDVFTRLGAAAWARRAGAELRATGESRADTTPAADLRDRLTPQELQVVTLAARGASNRDIGERMYLSPRTVGHHLYKAFPKLGVANRAELAALFPE
ncbi:regulatory LuxR family protein [Stackebrandtia albiflava]|uniref:Regulatory LuxR family protein n=1 Tax=Stackebrandtia albiflava TaxID=406432 RepID=A0A562V1B4_9ACTN|nr:helix-turn-helix transcriptional regulator [Stackebrandtia albiflava]TWJ11699.1 regulatory LuxR family protein [Stackebrandtia albiflava]